MTKRTEGTGSGYSEEPESEKYQVNKERYEFIDQMVFQATLMVFPYHPRGPMNPGTATLDDPLKEALTEYRKKHPRKKANGAINQANLKLAKGFMAGFKKGFLCGLDEEIRVPSASLIQMMLHALDSLPDREILKIVRSGDAVRTGELDEAVGE